jgi:hypothetical protein
MSDRGERAGRRSSSPAPKPRAASGVWPVTMSALLIITLAAVAVGFFVGRRRRSRLVAATAGAVAALFTLAVVVFVALVALSLTVSYHGPRSLLAICLFVAFWTCILVAVAVIGVAPKLLIGAAFALGSSAGAATRPRRDPPESTGWLADVAGHNLSRVPGAPREATSARAGPPPHGEGTIGVPDLVAAHDGLQRARARATGL